MNTENVENKASRSRGLLVAGILLIGVSAFIMFGLKPGGPTSPGLASEQAASTVNEPETDQPRIVSTSVLQDMLGIEVAGLQLSVGGTRIDMRYKVVDSQKAMALTNRMFSATLVTTDGKTLSLPNTPKGSPLRQDSGSQLVAGRTYANLFPNPGNAVKSGDTVTLRIGNLRAENLVVH